MAKIPDKSTWLGRRLIELKKDQQEVTDALKGGGAPAVSNLARGKRRIDFIAEAVKLANSLEWSVEELYYAAGGADKPTHGFGAPAEPHVSVDQRSFITGIHFGLAAAGVKVTKADEAEFVDACREALARFLAGMSEDAVLTELRERNNARPQIVGGKGLKRLPKSTAD